MKIRIEQQAKHPDPLARQALEQSASDSQTQHPGMHLRLGPSENGGFFRLLDIV